MEVASSPCLLNSAIPTHKRMREDPFDDENAKKRSRLEASDGALSRSNPALATPPPSLPPSATLPSFAPNAVHINAVSSTDAPITPRNYVTPPPSPSEEMGDAMDLDDRQIANFVETSPNIPCARPLVFFPSPQSNPHTNTNTMFGLSSTSSFPLMYGISSLFVPEAAKVNSIAGAASLWTQNDWLNNYRLSTDIDDDEMKQ